MEHNANKTIITVVGKVRKWSKCFRYFPDHRIWILQYDDDR